MTAALRSSNWTGMAVQAYSVQDAYIYGFALQEPTLLPGGRDEFARAARKRVREVKSKVEDVARLHPNVAVVVGGHVAKHGYSAPEAFEAGLDVILGGLERLRSLRSSHGLRSPGEVESVCLQVRVERGSAAHRV